MIVALFAVCYVSSHLRWNVAAVYEKGDRFEEAFLFLCKQSNQTRPPSQFYKFEMAEPLLPSTELSMLRLQFTH